MPRGQRARCGAFDGGSEMIALSAANDSSEISGIGASGRDLWSTATTSSVSTRMASRAAAELSTPPGLRGSLTLHGIEAMRAMHAAWNSRCVSRPARASAMRSPNIARNMDVLAARRSGLLVVGRRHFSGGGLVDLCRNLAAGCKNRTVAARDCEGRVCSV